MIHGKTILAVIPARGGSKGIPRKNIRDVAGKPLLAWTIEEAKKSKFLDRLVLSSNDLEIIETARQWNCEVPFIRPEELSLDTTPGIDPILHVIANLPEKYDYVVLLQVTSPLRTIEDIDGCIEYCLQMQACSCVSVTEAEKSPYWMYTLDSTAKLHPLLKVKQINRRQDLPQVFALNGAVYVASCNWLKVRKNFFTDETVGYVMPRERSMDIDTEIDLAITDYLLHCKL